MVVQSTSTGGDLGNNHFDIAMPGGGVGVFDGCTPQFGSAPGERYGGVSSRAQCSQFPAALQPGCNWRFDWFQNADNPTFTFTQVQCPAEIVAKSGCKRSDDSSFPVFTPPSGGSVGSGGGAGSSSSSSQPATTTTAQATSTSVSSAPAPSTSQGSGSGSGGGCTAQKWAQCGGTGFSGCTTCASGSTCQKQNEYYSQCL